MDRPAGGADVYLAMGATDMHKSINGLSLLVEELFELNLFTGNLFAFCNRRRNMVKILYWDTNGLYLAQTVVAGSVPLAQSEQEVMEISPTALNWLLHSPDVRQAHRWLSYVSVAKKNILSSRFY